MNKIIINGKELTWDELAKILGEKEVEKIEITTEFPDGELKLSFEENCLDCSEDYGWEYKYNYFDNSFSGFIGQTPDGFEEAYITINQENMFISSNKKRVKIYPKKGKVVSFNDNTLKAD